MWLSQQAPGPCAPRFSRLSADELDAAREAGVAELERAFLVALMDRHGGNVSQAARESGFNRTYLQKLLAKHRVAGAGGRRPAFDG